MKTIIVIIFTSLVGLMGCSSDGPSKGQARAQALVEWNSMEAVAQELACTVYNDSTISTEDLYRQMTTGDNKVPWEEAKAKLDILEEKC